MAEPNSNQPRPRLLVALAVLTAAALLGIVPFTRSEAATRPEKDRTDWYDIVRESVKIVMAGGPTARTAAGRPTKVTPEYAPAADRPAQRR